MKKISLAVKKVREPLACCTHLRLSMAGTSAIVAPCARPRRTMHPFNRNSPAAPTQPKPAQLENKPSSTASMQTLPPPPFSAPACARSSERTRIANAHAHTRTHARTRARARTHTHTHTRTHARTHTHTCLLSLALNLFFSHTQPRMSCFHRMNLGPRSRVLPSPSCSCPLSTTGWILTRLPQSCPEDPIRIGERGRRGSEGGQGPCAAASPKTSESATFAQCTNAGGVYRVRKLRRRGAGGQARADAGARGCGGHGAVPRGGPALATDPRTNQVERGSLFEKPFRTFSFIPSVLSYPLRFVTCEFRGQSRKTARIGWAL